LVRTATLADIPDIVRMGAMLHAESPRYSRLAFDAGKVDRLARSLLAGTAVSDPVGGVFVLEIGGVVVGMIAGMVQETFFGPDTLASDWTFYIEPGHRGGRKAGQLLQAFEQWAISKGVTDIVPGTSTEIAADATRRFYEANGYTLYGYAMIKRVK